MLRSIVLVALLASSAFAQRPSPPRKPPHKTPPMKPEPPPRHDMDVMDIAAKNRKIMLVTFLERASEELRRSSLEKRSFVPELIETVDAEQL